MKVTPGLPEAEVCEQEAYPINIGEGEGGRVGRGLSRDAVTTEASAGAVGLCSSS